MNKPDLINRIINLATDFDLYHELIDENTISIRTSPFLGIQLRISIKSDRFLHFFFHIKTSSWQYDGERTDLHDLISLTFGVYLKELNICSPFFVDERNPVTNDHCEIYSRHIISTQQDSGLIFIESIDDSKFHHLVMSLQLFENLFWSCFGGCPCDNCRTRLKLKYQYRWEDISQNKLRKVVNAFGKSETEIYCERTLPTWFYYKVQKEMSFIESYGLLKLIRSIYSNNQIINGIDEDLYLNGHFKNSLSHTSKSRIIKYFDLLKDKNPKFILFENKVVAFGKKYILSVDNSCGIDAFKQGKERLKTRHNKEFELLFKPSEFFWVDPIDPSKFENLIKDLLEKEPTVTWIRNSSQTNEPDGGTDLIARMRIPKKSVKNAKESPYKEIKVIVQCKVSKRGIGKSKVTDIRDTVDSRNYDGYFLAVSSYVNRSLSEYLDRLKLSEKVWTDWWTKTEIEERLSANEDILKKYKALVQPIDKSDQDF